MARAIQLSLENFKTGQGNPFGAVIVGNDVLVSEGVNRDTALTGATAHAEVNAIREACAKLGVRIARSTRRASPVRCACSLLGTFGARVLR